MDLKNLETTRLICEIRYALAPIHHARGAEIIQDLIHDFGSYSFTDPGSFQLRDDSKAQLFHVSTRNAIFDWERCTDVLQSFRQRAEALFSKVCHKYQIESLKRIGLRQYFVLPVAEPFEGLVNRYATALLRPQQGLWEKVGPIADVGIILDFSSDGGRGQLHTGPMTQEQLCRQFLVFGRNPAISADVVCFANVDVGALDQRADKIGEFIRRAAGVGRGKVEALFSVL